MIDLQLDHKVAIVTGASRGLGHAAALALHQQENFLSRTISSGTR